MNRTIIVKEDGKVVYEGPENRHAHNVALVQPSKFFGLSFESWIKIVGFIIFATIFYIRTDDFMKAQLNINTYLMDYANNSDIYHAATTGRPFHQGKPEQFQIIQPAYAGQKEK